MQTSLCIGTPFLLAQVLVTPHSAFLTNEALYNIATTTVTNITNWVLNEPLGRNEVEAPKVCLASG